MPFVGDVRLDEVTEEPVLDLEVLDLLFPPLPRYILRLLGLLLLLSDGSEVGVDLCGAKTEQSEQPGVLIVRRQSGVHTLGSAERFRIVPSWAVDQNDENKPAHSELW